jgi:selenide,water dikinase
VTGAAAPAWPRASGLQTDAAGFIAVDTHLQSLSHPGVFAAGDIASMQDTPRPKSGVYAVRQGPPLTENLRRALRGEPLVEYHPQARALALISAGDRYAVASYGPFALSGAWVWRWKDRIDSAFMQRYRAAPENQ